MKFLILLALLTLAVTAFYQIPLKRFESPMAKMMKAGTWKDYITKKDAIRSIAHKLNKKYTQNVTDYEDVEYSANITIGTPGQIFKVSLDTTSSFLWVPDKTCNNEMDLSLQHGPSSKSANEKNAENVSLDRIQTGCKEKNKFDQTKSSTYLINGTKFETSFGEIPNPLWVFGFLGEDTVKFGESESKSLTVPKVTFGQANFISSAFAGWSIDGVLGLAFPALTPYHILSPFFEAIKQGLVDEPVFTVHLANTGNEHVDDGGTFTYGGRDDVNCEPVLAYEALTSTTYYQFKLKILHYGCYTSYQNWQAISDTSTAFIYAPYFVVHNIVKEAKSEFSDTYQCYVVDCKAELPDIELGIGDETYRIHPKNYISEILDGVCCLRIFYTGGTAFVPEWILGYPFLWSFCTTYDVEKKQIGFALPKTK